MTSHQSRIIFAACFSLLLFSCSQKRATPVIDATVKTILVNPIGVTSLKVMCPDGTQMVGGGFFVNPDALVYVVANFPVSKNTWEVDVVSTTKPVTDQPTLSVYVYYYTGDKNLGMEIKKEDQPITPPDPAGFQIQNSLQTTILKPFPNDVVTSGGFKSSVQNINAIAVVGSYPALRPAREGVPDNVTGWTNNVTAIKGSTGTVTNYVLFSGGNVVVGSTTPIFDQGSALVKRSNLLPVNSAPAYQLEGSSNYFCTGGGYNFVSSPYPLPLTYPPRVTQNNANTSSGIFFGWEFAGTSFYSNDVWDVYALQIKLH